MKPVRGNLADWCAATDMEECNSGRRLPLRLKGGWTGKEGVEGTTMRLAVAAKHVTHFSVVDEPRPRRKSPPMQPGVSYLCPQLSGILQKKKIKKNTKEIQKKKRLLIIK